MKKTAALLLSLLLVALVAACGAERDLYPVRQLEPPKFRLRVVGLVDGYSSTLWRGTVVLDEGESQAIFDQTAALLEAGTVVTTTTAFFFALWSDRVLDEELDARAHGSR